MKHKMQEYMSDIGENMEKEGDAIKEYQSLKTRIMMDVHYCKCRLAENEESKKNKDDMMLEWRPMTEEEVEEAEKFLEDAKDLLETLDEIIGDEMNHQLKLLGKMTKYGYIRAGQDGLANAIQEIAVPKKSEEDGDDN